MEAYESLCEKHEGKVSDKWHLYTKVYSSIFKELEQKKIKILELGIQNGGSLEIYSNYFLNAEKIVGCDIADEIGELHFDDHRIHLVVGDATEQKTKDQITKISSDFDIIIDDASHISSDIIKSFLIYWPMIDDQGLYIIEDLHCSYWLEYEGGVQNPFSSVNFFKKLVDIINFDHWGIDTSRDKFLQKFTHEFRMNLNDILRDIYSIQFIDSMCIVQKKVSENLGVRKFYGQHAHVKQIDSPLAGKGLEKSDQRNNIWSMMDDQHHPIFTHLIDVYERHGVKKLEYTVQEREDKHNISLKNVHPDPTVALIIPYYNGKNFIDRCVESIITQTVKYDEVIIVDDGSSKEHAAYLDKFQAHFEIKVLTKENGGQGSARNYGVKHSSSDFVCFIDQDDYLLPNHNEKLSKQLSENISYGYVYGDAVEANGEGDIIRYGMIKDHALHPKTNIIHFLYSDCFILPSASMITREAFDRVGGFDEQFTGYEDDDLFMRLWRKGYQGYFVDQPVYVWCIHLSSTSFSIKMSQSRLRYIKKLEELFPTDAAFNRYYFRDLIFPRFYGLLLGDLRRYVSDKASSKEVRENMKEFIRLAKLNNVSKRTIRKLEFFSFCVRTLPSNVVRIGEIFAKKIRIL